jgi:DNA-binding response OmpR family regulator
MLGLAAVMLDGALRAAPTARDQLVYFLRRLIMKIAVLDDNQRVANLLSGGMSHDRLECSVFESESHLFTAVRQQKFDLYILNDDLQKSSGRNVIPSLRRETGNVPGIFVLAQHVKDAVVLNALDNGADDVIAKSNDASILVAKIRALWRKNRENVFGQYAKKMMLNNVEIDYLHQQVTTQGKSIHCTPREIDLLWLFFANAGTCLSRSEIVAAIWGNRAGVSSQSLFQHIYSLRHKLALEKYGLFLKSVYGAGYKLEVTDQSPSGSGSFTA